MKFWACFHRVLSCIMSAALAVGLTPLPAHAAGADLESAHVAAVGEGSASVAQTQPDGHASGRQPALAAQGLAGEGTEEAPFLIGSESELAAFRDSVNGKADGENAYEGVFFALCADIALQGAWAPIGYYRSWSDQASFKGIFDGCGHVISGLDVRGGSSDYQGLFGFVGGTVENVVVEGSVAGRDIVGGVVGYADADAVVSCVGSKVNVFAAGDAGGVVGKASYRVKVTQCYNKGDVESADIYNYVGGVVGAAPSGGSVEVVSCYNTASVKNAKEGVSYVGGISGGCATVRNCLNAGFVESPCSESLGAVTGGYFQTVSKSADASYYLDGSCAYAAQGGARNHIVRLAASQMEGSSEYPAQSGNLLLGSLNACDEGGADYSGRWLWGSSLGQLSPMLFWEYVAGTPAIVKQPVGHLYGPGETVQPLVVAAALPEESQGSGALSFQWFASADGEAFDVVEGATGAGTTSAFTPSLSAGEQGWYYCLVADVTGDGKAVTNRTHVVNVMVHSDVAAAKPVFTVQPAAVAVQQTDTAILEAVAGFGDSPSGCGDISYQWYECDDAAGANPQAIDGAVGTVFTGADTSTIDSVGYYRCKATNTFEYDKTSSEMSDVAAVTVAAITVSSPADLLEVARNVNGGSKSYEGLTVMLLADIDLSSNGDTASWTPIGDNSSYPFKGTFDGGGHVISGLRVSDDGVRHPGLFGVVDGATIRDLIVRGSVERLSSGYGTAGVAGVAKGSSTFLRVGNEASVFSEESGSTGGIVGSTSEGSSNYPVEIMACYNKGDISGYGDYVAGIVGNAYAGYGDQGWSKIVSCYNTGTVKQLKGGNNYAVGGITGRIGSVKNCVNAGVIVNSDGNSHYGAMTGTDHQEVSDVEDACYYLDASVDSPNWSQANVFAVTAGQLCGAEFYPEGSTAHLVAALNAGKHAGMWVRGDMTAAGQDCPALAWEADEAKPEIVSIAGDSTHVKVGEATTVSVRASAPAGSAGSVSFAWYARTGADTVAVDAASASTADNPDGTRTSTLTVVGALPSTVAYYCVVTHAWEGGSASAGSDSHIVNYYDYGAATPTQVVISSIPDTGEVMVADQVELSAEVSFADGATGVNEEPAVLYQWYSSAAEDGDYVAVEGATGKVFRPSTRSVGTTYYKVGARNVYYGDTSVETKSTRAHALAVADRTVSDEASMRAFAKTVNDGFDYGGLTVTMSADVKLTSAWVPIGTYADAGHKAPFRGAFDGAGHVVSGLQIESEGSNQGLFGYVEGATIENLVVRGMVRAVKGSNVGGVVGYAQSPTILNVGNEVDVSAKGSAVGGIVGRVDAGYSNRATLTGCYNVGAIASLDSPYYCVGGIVGHDANGYTTVRSSYNLGAVSYRGLSSYSYVAGIIGGTGYNSALYNCFNAGTIVDASDGTHHGALIGGDYQCDESNYWLEGTSDKAGGSSAQGKAVSVRELLSADMVAKLNSDKNGDGLAEGERLYKAGAPVMHEGYPLLRWEGSISDASVEVTAVRASGPDSGVTPALKVTLGNGAELPASYYEASYRDPDGESVDVPIEGEGAYTVTVTGADPFHGSAEARFTILPSIAGRVFPDIPAQTYTGLPIEPPVEVEGLEEGVDYAVAYYDNVSAGDSAKAVVVGIGCFEGTVELAFRIEKADLSDCSIAPIDVQQYTGDALKPSVDVVNPAGVRLVEGVDFVAVYVRNTGSAAEEAIGLVKVTGVGNYQGSNTAEFRIVPELKNLEALAIDPISPQKHTGSAVEPAIVIAGLVEGRDFTVAYANNIDRGQANVCVTGAGIYVGKLTATFEIYGGVGKSLEDALIEAEPASYTGSAVVPKVKVAYEDGTVLAQGLEFSVSAPDDAVEPGVHLATVTAAPGVGVTGAARTVAFSIEPCDLGANAGLSGVSDAFYNGAEIEQKALTVRDSFGNVLVEGDDYLVFYEGNRGVGTASVIVAGTGKRYRGTLSASFAIAQATFDNAGVTASAGVQTYTGKPLTPALTVLNSDGIALVQGIDYLAKYANNTNAGTATVVIAGIGAYSGVLATTFRIHPAANTLATKNVKSSVKYAKLKKRKQMTASFVKTMGAGAQVYSVAKVVNAKNKAVSSSLRKRFNVSGGKVVIARGTPKGTYAVYVKARAAGDANHEASATKTAVAKVKIR